MKKYDALATRALAELWETLQGPGDRWFHLNPIDPTLDQAKRRVPSFVAFKEGRMTRARRLMLDEAQRSSFVPTCIAKVKAGVSLERLQIVDPDHLAKNPRGGAAWLLTHEAIVNTKLNGERVSVITVDQLRDAGFKELPSIEYGQFNEAHVVRNHYDGNGLYARTFFSSAEDPDEVRRFVDLTKEFEKISGITPEAAMREFGLGNALGD